MTTMTVQLWSIPDTHAFVANDSDALVAPLSPSTASPTSRVSIHCRTTCTMLSETVVLTGTVGPPPIRM